MKEIGLLVTLTGMAALIGVSPVQAQTTTPIATTSSVSTTLPEGTASSLQSELSGMPDSVKSLVLTFEQVRNSYLQKQNLLLIELRHATTPEEREQLRQQLQANRQQFMADLKGFVSELRTDLEALKGKISHAEFGRILDAAHSATSEVGHRHRGQS